MNRRLLQTRSLSQMVLLFVFSLFLSACGGSLYKVKPVVSAPLPDDAKNVSTNLISVRAVPLLKDEESQELFGANMPLAGILPVRVEIENNSGAVVDLKKARFSLSDSSGQVWKNLSVKSTVKRVMKADGFWVYTPASKQEFTDKLSEHTLNVDVPLNQSEKRAGILFFQKHDKGSVENPQGLVLKVEKLAEKIELQLN